MFLYKCIQPQGKRRFEKCGAGKKNALRYRKKKRACQKECSGGELVLQGFCWLQGYFLRDQSSRSAFESALAEVTKGYYEIEENESSSLSKEFAAEADKKSTDKEADKFLLKKCEQAESALQKLQKKYTKDEEQRKLLLLLAVNAELQKEWERAAVYYEQLLLYAPEFAEGYGKYGLFLLRRGQKNSSRRLYVLYRSSKADGTDCKSVEIWEKQMESETGEGK